MINLINRLTRKISNLVKRAYVSNVSKDDADYNIVQVTYLVDTTGDAEVINPYGLYTNLPKDIQVLLFSVNGIEENRACMGYSQKGRFKNLLPGEVLVGNPKLKTFIKFDNEGNIDIESKAVLNIKAAAEINITAVGDINIDGGDINIVNGTINVTGDAEINADNVKLNANKVDLGVGGPKIARFGDTVQVSVLTGTGTITSGGTNTSI